MTFLTDRQVLAAIAINLMPIAGIVLFGWSAFVLMLLYWLENLIIGGYTLARMLVGSYLRHAASLTGALAIGAFFVLHYGLFCFVHGVFVFAMVTLSDAIYAGIEPPADPFNLVGGVLGMLEADRELFWSVVALIVVQMGAFAVFWVGGQRWREVEPIRQMFEPYGRILVMHLTIFIVTIPVLLLGQPMFAVLVLALLKSGLELGLKQFQVAAPDLTSPQR